MEEEEVVISSWQQSDFPKDTNDSFPRTINRGSSKENIDMNAWLSKQDSKIMGSSEAKSEDDEIILDDESLSKLIEGDLRSDEENESFNRPRKPKPKPRHEMGFSNTKSQPANDLADKLFSDKKDKADDLFSIRKNSADKLFSGGKGNIDKLFSGGKDFVNKLGENKNASADKLFSGGKVKEKDDDVITSPRPVPRPRSKPKDQKEDGVNSVNEMTGYNNVTADELFDSMGKSNKSVSFSDVQVSKDSTKKGSISVDQKSSSDRNSTIERTPPKKMPRSPRRGKSSEENDSEQTSPEHKKRPKPPQRHHDRKFLGESESADFESHRAGGGNVQYHRELTGDDVPSRGDTARGVKQMFYDGMSGERAKEGRSPRWETTNGHQNYGQNSDVYPRSKEEKIRGFRKGHGEEGDITDMFEEHIPASNGIVLSDEDTVTDRMNKHGMRHSGTKHKANVRSPMKAHKALNEMTKSPDMYNYKYESRDSPQNDFFSTSKGRSSSMTDLSGWRNTRSDEDSLDGSEFASSRGIRDAVYAEWLQKKQGKLKEAARKKVEVKKNEEEKIREKQEKEILAKKAFEAWSTKKEVVVKTETKKKKEIKNKEIDEKREKIIKKQDAKKFFESWKSKKDEVLKESYKDKKAKEREDKQKKIEEHKEQIEIAKKSYDKWKSKKDEQLKEEARSARRGEKLKTKYEKEAEMEKRQECEKTFQEFLRKKGTGKRAPPSPTLIQRSWYPGGLTRGTNLIPEKIQPVIAPPALNRSRSFSGTTRAAMSFNSTKRLSRGW